MTRLRYLTHPEVTIEPDVAVDRWGLSDRGVARAETMARQPWVSSVGRIITSDETKARQTADILGARLAVAPEIRPGTGENDRRATGFVAPDRFEVLADRFFATPARSVEGWERALDAQQRILAELADLLGPDPDPAGGDVAVVGHGGVGTLLLCALAGLAISRTHDQPGQGHVFSFDRATGTVDHRWLPIDRADLPADGGGVGRQTPRSSQ